MNARHGPSCAAKLRRRGESGQWPKLRIAEEIVACCGVSRLRAHRLAQGWTLVQAVEFFRELCGREDLRCPRIDVDQLRAWETSGRRPVPGTVDLLCRLYRTSPHELGLDVASDHTPEADRPPPDPVGGGGVLEAVRRNVDRTLVAATVSGDQLDLLDERLMSHRRRYVALSPQAMLPDLVADLDEVRALAEQRQPAATQARLSHMTAVLATLIADALMKLGQLRAAAAWYATARTAADDSRDRNVQARVRIQAAILPYYYGPLDAAIRLTQEARLIAPGSETDGTRAFGAVAHARALARRGDARGAEAALCAARDLFAQLDHTRPATDALGFPARRFLLYTSGTLTYLGRTPQARAAQQEALALYLAHDAGIDPALLHFEEAICLVLDRDVTEACRLATNTLLGLPPEQRTQIVRARVRHILDAIPARMRSTRAARELGEILALPRRRT
ncbi:hypothetical protein [Streptomyces sp. AcE210]|uniref:hypothetical protein n=1 Tax=Streptomyces sp. AcE210 TaxID=2292703 RepID=UPI001F0C16FB|nr:hypothetical protein [Streptomyces sp. AcE210]